MVKNASSQPLSTAHTLLNYWRQSRADAELMEWSHVDIGQEELVDSEVLAQGMIPQSITVRLFERMLQGKTHLENEQESLPVVIAPIVARPRYQHAKTNSRSMKSVTPLWIPAQLTLDGQLLPRDEQAMPWICRSLLEPSDELLTLGQLSAFDQYLTQTTLAKDDKGQVGWEQLLQYGLQMLEAASNNAWQPLLEQNDYELLNISLIKYDDGIRKVSHHILKVYDDLSTHHQLPPLFSAYAQLQDHPKESSFSKQTCVANSKYHLAHLNDKFPLSPSQREAMSHAVHLAAGEILAINGPPGTGKTTLLHDIIMSMWVQAAINSEKPPIVVVSSTNNQAVTNVLDSLRQVSALERWLPAPVRGLGLYLVNDGKKQKQATLRGYHWLGKAGNLALGLPAEIENYEYIAAAKKYFLEQSSQALEREILAIPDAITLLRNEIRNLHVLLTTGIEINQQICVIAEQHLQKYQDYGGLAKYQKALEKNLLTLNGELEQAIAIQKAWEAYIKQQPKGWKFFKFLPRIKQKIKQACQTFLQNHADYFSAWPAMTAEVKEISESLQKNVQQLEQNHTEIKSALVDAKNDEDDWLLAQKKWFKWLDDVGTEAVEWSQLFHEETPEGHVERTNLLNWLDMHLRYQMFVKAVHYWEGRWLLAVEQLALGKPEKQNFAARSLTWQRYAMLTPCFVTTLFSGPGFFDAWQEGPKPCYEIIDLLIIDEAGQVTPDVAGAMFALAKKALVIGDKQQIEPVWSISRLVDQGNAKRYGLYQDANEFEALVDKGVLASSGSVMTIAQRASHYQTKDANQGSFEPGLFLAEHRRCLPQIISYCNTLAYGGRLKSRRPSTVVYPWAPMCMMHVAGKSQMLGGSRINREEAIAIINWLVQHLEIIQQSVTDIYPGKKLADLIGIITPFTQQRFLLERLLAQANLPINKVGTVHALQGAERSLIVFSPVYSAEDATRYFFDRSVHMLNVAVSRAKDSFMVIGDSGIFKPKLKSLPSGLLANYLEQFSEENVKVL